MNEDPSSPPSPLFLLPFAGTSWLFETGATLPPASTSACSTKTAPPWCSDTPPLTRKLEALGPGCAASQTVLWSASVKGKLCRNRQQGAVDWVSLDLAAAKLAASA